MSKRETQVEISERAERIEQAINYLNQKITEIESEGELTPEGCSVVRYTARGRKNRYWYYQLKADIDGLKLSWSDLYSDEKKVGNRVD